MSDPHKVSNYGRECKPVYAINPGIKNLHNSHIGMFYILPHRKKYLLTFARSFSLRENNV